MKSISRSGTLAISCSIFLTLGMLVAGLGPALPELAINAGSTLAALGAVFTALFSGAFLAQLVVGPLSDRVGQRPLIGLGMLLLGAGMFGVTVSRSLVATLACTAVAGLGHGTLIIILHVLIAQLFTTRSVSALNLINVFFGIGAVAGPALAGLALRRWDTALPVLWFGGGLMLVQLILVPFLAVGSPAASHGGRIAEQRQLYKTPILWLLGMLLFLYIGMESAVGGWTTVYLERSAGLAADRAALVASGFWLALTSGRVIGTLIGGRLAPTRLLKICLIGAFSGGLGFVFSSGNVALSSGAILLMGLCFGPVFPTTLAVITAAFPQAQGTATSIVLGIGNTGGIVLPWLMGVLLTRHSPQSGTLLVLAGTLSMVGIFTLYGLLRSRRPATQPNTA